MALKIRLSRGGAKKRPYYRIVVAHAGSPRDGRFIERVGLYNPMLPKDHQDRIVLFEERIRHWLEHGAQPTDRVAKFLANAGVAEPRPIPNQTKKNQPKAKAQERMKARAEAEAAVAAAAEEAAGGGEPAAETPATEEAASE